MNKESEKEISLEQFKLTVRNYWQYLFSKWPWFLSIACIAGILGIIYAWMQKPVYTAEITFAAESENTSSLGAYAGLAAQFGFDAGTNGGAFEGENLMELMHSRVIIEKTLLSPVEINGKKQLLINYYIDKNNYAEEWSKMPQLGKIRFTGYNDPPDRIRDSVLMSLSDDFTKTGLQIDKVDKKLDIISARMQDADEFFAKAFIEQLVSNVIQYYVEYKSQKSRQNVEILRRQTDSVRNILNGNIVQIAESNDLNVNPLRQVVRTGVQRKQVDVQVNSALYGELVKNLELSKISLRKETPLIQLIDTPRFPLPKKKMGRLTAGILFAFAAFGITLFYFFIKKLLQI